MTALVFDRVVIATADGAVSLSVAQFAALPLTERLRAVFEKRLHFFRGAEPVDSGLALKSLREISLSDGRPKS